MMKFFMINCKEATYLLAIQEENKLSFGKRIKLWMHTSMCKFCNLFKKQTKEIAKENKNIRSDELLSDTSKIRLRQIVDEHYQ